MQTSASEATLRSVESEKTSACGLIARGIRAQRENIRPARPIFFKLWERNGTLRLGFRASLKEQFARPIMLPVQGAVVTVMCPGVAPGRARPVRVGSQAIAKHANIT